MLTKELIKKKHPGKKLEKMKYLNIWGEDIENIDIISEMKGLKLISLSANKISSLKPLENLVQLKELYLRQNNISDINEINYLSNCPNLKSLWLVGNPICKNNDEFLKAIIEKLPNLAFLDNRPIAEIKKDLDNKNYVIDENIILEDKKEVEKETDLVVQGEITKNNFYVNNNNNKENEKNETEKENEENKEIKINEENDKKEKEKENDKEKDKNKDLLDDLFYNGIENNDKKEDENKNELKQTKNKLLVSTVDKLQDLLLDNDKEESTNVNEDKSNNLNDKTNFLDSKSDIFKTGFTYKRNEDENKENKPEQNDNNNDNNDNNENNDLNKGKDIHNPLRLADFKEENNELLNNILKNVDTSQSFIRKTNTNKTIKITPNMIETNEKNNINNNINNAINNIIDNKNDNNNNIIKTNNNDENSFTKNLNDMIKNANMNISSQSFKLGKNTGLTNILNNINTSQTMPRKIENNVSNILREINTSQTMNKRKDQQVNDILKDVETTTTNFNKGNIDINDINNLEKNNANPNFQSIDDIKKMFNNDFPRNNDNNNNNLYGNNNIKDTRINEIFKNEKITSDSMLPSNNKEKGPVKLEYDNNFINKNYEFDYDKRQETDNGKNDGNGGNNKNYNLNPRHEHKINAIINLLEDLNLENLLHIKNQIIKMMKSNK